MSFKVILETQLPSELNLKGGFDNPKNGFRAKDDEMFVSGWFYKPNTNITVVTKKILTDGTHTLTEHSLSMNRPDVIKYLGLNLTSYPLGFQFVIKLEQVEKIEVFVKLNHQHIKRWTAIKPKLPSLCAVDDAQIYWQKIHKFEAVEAVDCKLNFFNSIKGRVGLYETEDFQELFQEKYPNCKIDFKGFIQQFQIKDWSVRIISKLDEGETLQINGFREGEKFGCIASFVIDDMNFLFFSSKEDCFYLVQHSTNIALFFPLYFGFINLLLEIKPWVDEAHNKLPRLFKYLYEIREQFVSCKDNFGKFAGVLLANSRPYHFFYDYMYGLSTLMNNTGPMRKFNVVGVHGMDFFPKNLFHGNYSYTSLAEAVINDKVMFTRTFLLKSCVLHFKNKSENGLQALTNRVCGTLEIESKLDVNLDEYELVIWIGVSTEKRSWVEQVDGYSSILQSLSSIFKKILVLIDGRTFPVNPREIDRIIKSQEDMIYDSIFSANKSIDFINMIGLSAEEKIFLAKKIDFFITSYSTDSMYPSAICAKPGVVYVAPSIGDQKDLHVHHNIIEVPSDKVTEIRDPNKPNQAWYELSVSMDWRDVYDCVLNLINKYGIRKCQNS